MSIQSRNWQALEVTPSERMFAIEVTGEVELPSPARAVVLRPVDNVFNPTILALEVIPLGQGFITVMSWEKCGYLHMSTTPAEFETVQIVYQDETIANFPIEKGERQSAASEPPQSA